MTDRELLETLVKDMAEMKGQLKENTDYIKALVHSTDELDAKFDGLAVNTAKGFERVEERLDRIEKTQMVQGESINLLAMKQLQTETEISLLKKAK